MLGVWFVCPYCLEWDGNVNEGPKHVPVPHTPFTGEDDVSKPYPLKPSHEIIVKKGESCDCCKMFHDPKLIPKKYLELGDKLAEQYKNYR